MVIFPAGSLTKNNIPLIIQVKNIPSDGLVIKDSTTNAQLGRYFDFGSYNSIVSGKSVTMQFPVVEHIGQSNVYAVQSSGTSPVSYDTVKSTSGNAVVTAVLKNTHAVTLAQKQSEMGEQTVYYDDGTVYSSKKSKSVFIYNFHMATRFAEGTSNYYESGKMLINYDDYSTTPSVNKTISADLSFYRIHRSEIINGVTFYFGYLSTDGSIQSSGKMRINSVTVNLDATSSMAAKTVTLSSLSYQVYPGRTLHMTMSLVFNNGQITTTPENSAAFSFSPGDLTFESADMAGEGRILMDANYALNQVYYTYQYYLKDHLGSTRMVIGNNQALAEAVMYQPYGTMSDPLSMSTPEIEARKKFTGKEYDKEGAVSNVSDGMKLDYFGARYYDPEIGVWTAADPLEQAWNDYVYCMGDPINSVDPDGMYISPLNELSLTNKYNFEAAEVKGGLEGSTGEALATGGNSAAIAGLSLIGSYFTNTGIHNQMVEQISQHNTQVLGQEMQEQSQNIGNTVQGLDNGNAGSSGTNAAGSLSGTKEALKQVKDLLGDNNMSKGEPGKWDSPQRGNSIKGYRLDPGHGSKAPVNEQGPHINYWDYTKGKYNDGKGPGLKGAIPIRIQFIPAIPLLIIPLPLLQQFLPNPPPES